MHDRPQQPLTTHDRLMYYTSSLTPTSSSRAKVSQSAGTTRARPSATRCATSGRCTPPPSSRAPRARRPRRCPRPPAARGDPEDAAALESGASLADDDKASGGGGGRGGGRAAGGGSGKSEAEHAQQLKAEGFALDDGGDGGDDGLGGGRDDDDAELLGGILHESRRERLAREKEDRLRGGNGGDGHPAPAAAVPLLTRALRHGDFDFGTVAAALARTPAPYAFHDSRLALALHYWPLLHGLAAAVSSTAAALGGGVGVAGAPGLGGHAPYPLLIYAQGDLQTTLAGHEWSAGVADAAGAKLAWADLKYTRWAGPKLSVECARLPRVASALTRALGKVSGGGSSFDSWGSSYGGGGWGGGGGGGGWKSWGGGGGGGGAANGAFVNVSHHHEHMLLTDKSAAKALDKRLQDLRCPEYEDGGGGPEAPPLAQGARCVAVWLCELRVSPGSGAIAVEEEKTENTTRNPRTPRETRGHLEIPGGRR